MQSADLLREVHLALELCARAYNPKLRVVCNHDERSGPSRSRVDWTILVNDEVRILLEAESPAVMEAISQRLPAVGVYLKWQTGTQFLSKIFLKVHNLISYFGRRHHWPKREHVC
jgi:hypothetical protein